MNNKKLILNATSVFIRLQKWASPIAEKTDEEALVLKNKDYETLIGNFIFNDFLKGTGLFNDKPFKDNFYNLLRAILNRPSFFQALFKILE